MPDRRLVAGPDGGGPSTLGAPQDVRAKIADSPVPDMPAPEMPAHEMPAHEAPGHEIRAEDEVARGIVAVPVGIGRRVVVLANLGLSADPTAPSLQAAAGVANALDSWQGPGTVVL